MRWRVVVKGTGFIRRGRGWRQQLGAHMRYCDRASAREGTRLDRDRDDAGRSEFVNAAAEGPGRVAAFKFICSFRSPEAAPRDVREWTRKYVHALEERWGAKLTWSAVQHKGAHPHVHLVIAGSYEDERGKKRALFLNREQLKEMKTVARREFYKARPDLWVVDKIEEVARSLDAPRRRAQDLAHVPVKLTGGTPKEVRDVVKTMKDAKDPWRAVPMARMQARLKQLGIKLDLAERGLGAAMEL